MAQNTVIDFVYRSQKYKYSKKFDPKNFREIDKIFDIQHYHHCYKLNSRLNGMPKRVAAQSYQKM